MNKFDLVEKINPQDLLGIFAKTPLPRTNYMVRGLPHQLLREEGIMKPPPARRLGVSSFSPYTPTVSSERRSPPARGGMIRLCRKIKGDWFPYYFNWGRNALFFLFKKLPFAKISFPAFTCPTLTEAAEAAGKEVELLEIDIETFNLDPGLLKNKKIECLVVVHTFGNPCNIGKIKKILPKTFIIEDCAHALFAKIDDEYLGNRGDVVLFSLYKQIPNINGSLLLVKEKFKIKQKEESLFAYPKRVLVKTNGPHQILLNLLKREYLPRTKTIDTSSWILHQIKTLKRVSQICKRNSLVRGLPEIEHFKYTEKRPNKLVFALFKKKLSKLKVEVEARRKIALFFKKELRNSRFFNFQKETTFGKSSFYQFPIYLKKPYFQYRDELGLFLRNRGIFVDRLWFDAPITRSRFKKFQKACPKALFLAKAILNLPIKGDDTKEDVKQLFDELNDFFETIG